jgi:hypothetical protein
MEDAPFAPLETLAALYGVARNVIWKGPPDNRLFFRIGVSGSYDDAKRPQQS